MCVIWNAMNLKPSCIHEECGWAAANLSSYNATADTTWKIGCFKEFQKPLCDQ